MPSFDIKSISRAENPFPALAQLRKQDPVHWSPAFKGWILTRYDDVRKALRSPQYSSDRLRPFFESLPEQKARELADLKHFIPLWLVFHQPPTHTRLRTIMTPGFLPSVIARMRPKIEALVDDLIDEFIDRGSVEFIDDFALRLPGYVIMDLLGVPRSDLPMIKTWSDELQLFIGGSKVTVDKYAKAQHGTHAMAEYFREVIRRKRAHPEQDFISMLIDARDETGQMSEDELITTCILLVFGGHETTTNLLGNGLLALIRNPGELEKLRANPALAAMAVEECLRYDGPSGSVVRIVSEDHELEGKLLRKGDRVFAMIPAANRDPAQFSNPDKFDIERSKSAHLTFGQGVHFCLGAPLARAEAIAAFPKLVSRLHDIHVATDKLEWRDATVMRGITALPLAFRRA